MSNYIIIKDRSCQWIIADTFFRQQLCRQLNLWYTL